MSKLPEPLLWSARQAAHALGISVRCFHYWAAGGRVPGFVSLNGNRRWQRRVIEEWISDGCKTVQPCANRFSDLAEDSEPDTLEP